MIDLQKDGKKLKIEILDYEFPNRDDLGGIPNEVQLEKMGGRDWDANWLNVQFDCQDEKYTWSVFDPAFLSWELEDMMTWFVHMAEGRDDDNVAPYLAFEEPCLLLYQKKLDEDNFQIRFAMAFEVAPPEEQRNGEYYMDFVLSRAEMAQIANTLAMAILKFPER